MLIIVAAFLFSLPLVHLHLMSHRKKYYLDPRTRTSWFRWSSSQWFQKTDWLNWSMTLNEATGQSRRSNRSAHLLLLSISWFLCFCPDNKNKPANRARLPSSIHWTNYLRSWTRCDQERPMFWLDHTKTRVRSKKVSPASGQLFCQSSDQFIPLVQVFTRKSNGHLDREWDWLSVATLDSKVTSRMKKCVRDEEHVWKIFLESHLHLHAVNKSPWQQRQRVKHVLVWVFWLCIDAQFIYSLAILFLRIANIHPADEKCSRAIFFFNSTRERVFTPLAHSLCTLFQMK